MEIGGWRPPAGASNSVNDFSLPARVLQGDGVVTMPVERLPEIGSVRRPSTLAGCPSLSTAANLSAF